MNSLKQFSKKRLKYNLLNRFCYSETKDFPTFEKIILNFGYKTTELKSLATSLLILELVTKQKATLIVTKYSNILLKIYKGNPVGCKVILRKKSAFYFLEKLLNEVSPKLKNIKRSSQIFKKVEKNFFSYELHETFNFRELENKYYLFNNSSKLDITFVSTSKFEEEFLFMLRSLQFSSLLFSK